MSEVLSLKNRLLKGTIVYSIGTFGSKVLSFFLIPFYTFFLTKEELGEYDILITVISLFIPLVSLQLSDAVYRWFIEKEETDENQKTKVVTSALAGLFLTYVAFNSLLVYYKGIFGFEYFYLVSISIFLNCLFAILQSILRGLKDTRKFAVNGIVTTLLIVVFNVLFIYLYNQKVTAILTANILAYCVSSFYIIYDSKLWIYIKLPMFSVKVLKEMVRYSLPLIPNLISWWLIGSASKFIILNYLGPENNGMFAVASRFPTVLVILNSVLILPIQDEFLKNESRISDLKHIVQRFFIFEFSIILLLVAAAPLYTSFMLDPEFAEAWRYTTFLFIGVGVNTLGALLGLVYQKRKKTIKITSSTLIGGLISIFLSFLVIEPFGLIGISFAYFVGFFIVLVLRYWDLKNDFDFSGGLLVKLVLVVSAAVLITYLNFKLDYINCVILTAITLIGVIYFNKNIIKSILRNVFGKAK